MIMYAVFIRRYNPFKVEWGVWKRATQFPISTKKRLLYVAVQALNDIDNENYEYKIKAL